MDFSKYQYWKTDKNRAYMKKWRRENRSLVNASARRTRRSNQLFVQKAKDVPCADCGGRFPYWIMQFDHVRGEKKFNIAERYPNMSLFEIKTEIAKCDVVCANCHCNRTFVRQQIVLGKLNV